MDFLTLTVRMGVDGTAIKLCPMLGSSIIFIIIAFDEKLIFVKRILLNEGLSWNTSLL
jgi:hypothetical protein